MPSKLTVMTQMIQVAIMVALTASVTVMAVSGVITGVEALSAILGVAGLSGGASLGIHANAAATEVIPAAIAAKAPDHVA